MTNILSAAAGLVLAAALLVGCGRPDPAPLPTGPWSASVSGGGGFTGGGASSTVHADGRVERSVWPTAGDPPTVTVTGTAPPELVEALLEAMRDPDLRALPPGEPANMTVTLRWDYGDETSHWQFAEGTSPPAPVERAIAALRSAAQAAR